MALSPGSRVGPYEVTAQLGEGGMGIVFRGRDSRLQRDVALKLLPDVFANDADRLLRFQREAQVLASLNHANIAQRDRRYDVAPDDRFLMVIPSATGPAAPHSVVVNWNAGLGP